MCPKVGPGQLLVRQNRQPRGKAQSQTTPVGVEPNGTERDRASPTPCTVVISGEFVETREDQTGGAREGRWKPGASEDERESVVKTCGMVRGSGSAGGEEMGADFSQVNHWHEAQDASAVTVIA